MRNYQNRPSGTISRARQLRREASPIEKTLLRGLRTAFPDAKFRHQSPFGPFYADFYSFSAQLVIELDGDSHADTQQQDAARTRFIESQGCRLIRFFNRDVIDNLEGLLQIVAANLLPSPSQG
jgi:very-short-patch-repair endonuclease